MDPVTQKEHHSEHQPAHHPAQSAPVADQVFCTNCGSPMPREAMVCVKCGFQNKAHPGLAHHHSDVRPKDKSVSVLLAVFLGFWTWVYTYEKDAGKFWLNLILTVITFGFWGLVAWLWAVINTATRPGEWYRNFPNG